jgi:crossover junction endodeoxyribonuclease RusA
MEDVVLRLSLDLAPMPAPRPRFRAMIVRGKAIGTAYSPKEYKEWQEKAYRAVYDEIEGIPLLEGPLTVGLIVTAKRPKTTKLSAPKPDVDNYAKSILDAMTKAGVWADDSQVEFLAVKKQWGPEDNISVEVRRGVP